MNINLHPFWTKEREYVLRTFRLPYKALGGGGTRCNNTQAHSGSFPPQEIIFVLGKLQSHGPRIQPDSTNKDAQLHIHLHFNGCGSTFKKENYVFVTYLRGIPRQAGRKPIHIKAPNHKKVSGKVCKLVRRQ